jgi:hypothetical protein
MACKDQELTPDEIAALADDITGVRTKDDGFFWDDVARAAARIEAKSPEDES